MALVRGNSYTIDANVAESRSGAIKRGLLGFRESLSNSQYDDRVDAVKERAAKDEAGYRIALGSIAAEGKTYIEQNADKNKTKKFDAWEESDSYKEFNAKFNSFPPEFGDAARAKFRDTANAEHAKSRGVWDEDQAGTEFGNGLSVVPDALINSQYDAAKTAGRMGDDYLFKTMIGALQVHKNTSGLVEFGKREDLTPEQRLSIQESINRVTATNDKERSYADELWIAKNKTSPNYVQGLVDRGIWEGYTNKQKAAASVANETAIKVANERTAIIDSIAEGRSQAQVVAAGHDPKAAKELFNAAYRKEDLVGKMRMITRNAYDLPEAAKQELIAGLSVLQPTDGANLDDLSVSGLRALSNVRQIVAAMGGSGDAVRKAVGETRYNDFRVLEAHLEVTGDITTAVQRLQQYKSDTQSGIKPVYPKNWGREKGDMVISAISDYDGPNRGHITGVLANLADSYVSRGLNPSEVTKLIKEDAKKLIEPSDLGIYNSGAYVHAIGSINSEYGTTEEEVHEASITFLEKQLTDSGITPEDVEISFTAGDTQKVVIRSGGAIVAATTVQALLNGVEAGLETKKERLAREAKERRENSKKPDDWFY